MLTAIDDPDARHAAAPGPQLSAGGGPPRRAAGRDPEPPLLAAALRRRPRRRGQVDAARRQGVPHRRRGFPRASVFRSSSIPSRIFGCPPQFPEGRANSRIAWAVGRLRPGVTLEAARAELDAILRAMPVKRRFETRVVLTPWQERITGQVKSTLLIFLASVGLVLLIACVNVANLLPREIDGPPQRDGGPPRARRGHGRHRPPAPDRERRARVPRRGLAGLAMAYAARGLLVAFLAQHPSDRPGHPVRRRASSPLRWASPPCAGSPSVSRRRSFPPGSRWPSA